MDIIDNFLNKYHDKMERIAINLTLLHGEEIASINLDRNININNLIMMLVDRINVTHRWVTVENDGNGRRHCDYRLCVCM